MAHTQETRNGVRRAYVFDRQSLEVAAAMFGVSYGTARRWKQQAQKGGDDWDKSQTAQLMAGGGLEDIARQVLSGLVIQFQATMEAVQSDEKICPATKVQMLASLADAYNKTVAASKRVLPETSSLATAMQVIQRLAEFIRQHYPKHGAVFAEILEPFGEVIAKEMG